MSSSNEPALSRTHGSLSSDLCCTLYPCRTEGLNNLFPHRLTRFIALETQRTLRSTKAGLRGETSILNGRQITPKEPRREIECPGGQQLTEFLCSRRGRPTTGPAQGSVPVSLIHVEVRKGPTTVAKLLPLCATTAEPSLSTRARVATRTQAPVRIDQTKQERWSVNPRSLPT